MSFINYFGKMLFGGPGDQGGRAPGTNNARIGEALVATTRRMIKGSHRGGHASVHVVVTASTGVTSATGLTVWYSNLPNPDLTTDTDWVQDTTAGLAPVIALTATGKALVTIGNVYAEWIMLKADVTAGTATLYVHARSENQEMGY